VADKPREQGQKATGEEPGREQAAPAVSPLTARPLPLGAWYAAVIVGWNNEMRASYLGSCLSFGWAYRGGPLCHMYGVPGKPAHLAIEIANFYIFKDFFFYF
jgi:hypothetical protein